MPDNSNRLNHEQGRALLRLARLTIVQALEQADVRHGGFRVESALPAGMEDPAFRDRRGTFVTLKIDGRLRGCMGSLAASETIVEGIRRNALNAAFNDPRFPPLTMDELKRSEIEISILTEPRPLEYEKPSDLLARLQPHEDGVIIRKGAAGAIFLPQVWDQLPRPEDFLGHLCLKAGLGAGCWREADLEVSIYRVQHFHEHT